MTVRVEGVLFTPINTPAANIPIKIITTVGAGNTLPTSEVTYVTDEEGKYGFDLVYATHEIYAMFDDAFELVGTSVANEAVPTPTSISDLLHFSTPIQPEIVDKIYEDVYGCIGDLETDINTCMTCMSDQVVQGDTGVCQAMTVYTNDCLQACSAELTTAIQAGDAQTLSQSQAYTDATGMEIACCTELLSTSMAELCTTMVAVTEANGSSITTLRTDMEAGDASIVQESKAYTDVCTDTVEASITSMVRACDAAAYTCMGAINCCITVVEANASKTWYQTEAPVGANIGDLWYDTDNENEPYYLSELRVWESIRDSSISVAQAEANAATASAHLACVCACAYADGVVSAEEARAIADAEAKANAAESAACNYAAAEANLVAVCSCAYADGIVTAEEARAIADAQAKADAAEAAAIAASDSLGSAAAAEQAACNYADANFVDSVTYGTDIAAIQQQLDKSITSWFGNDTPTASNYPASDWGTEEEKAIHLGDLYYDNDDGLSYRWSVDVGVYLWVQVVDSGITAALEAASKAQDTADSKRRVFFGTPVPPYDRGDLWDTGQGLRRADVASTTTFSEVHWLWATDANGAAESAGVAACNYALAQVNLEEVRANAYADGVATVAEQTAIAAAEACACAAAVNACAYADGIVTVSEQNAIDAANCHADAQDALAKVTSEAYADGVVSAEEARAIADAQAKADAAYTCSVIHTDATASGLSNEILVAQNTADQAVINAANAQATADGSVDTYYQASQPSTGKEGDIWVDTDAGNKQYMFANGAWRSVQDTGIVCAQSCAANAENTAQQALVDSAAAQSTADGKVRTFYQDSAPTSEMSEGDIWVDTNDGNNQYMYTSGGWVDIRDQAIYTEAASAEANACNFAKECVANVSAVETYRQDTQPTNPSNGDIWYDTSNGNAAYRFNVKGVAGAELYQVNVKKGYGYGYQNTLNNATPMPMLVRGAEVELFSSSEPDNKTLLWFIDMAPISDTSDMDVNVGGVGYTLTWNSGLKAFESPVGQHAFTADELNTTVPVYLDGAYGVWESIQDEVLVTCTAGLTGDIVLMQGSIIDVNEAVCLQQSGYGIVTCAGDAVASIELLATSYSNTDVACAEILMRADKIAMHSGNATSTTYPFYVEGDNVYMNCAMVNCLEGVEITSGVLCAGTITAAIVQSAGFNSCNNPAGGSPRGYCLGAGGDAELNNVVIRGVIEGSVVCGTTICGGIIKGSAIQSSYIATDVPSLTLTWANQEQYGSMDLTVICGQGQSPYMAYSSGVVATCTTTTPNLKIASYEYTDKSNYNRYTRRYITPSANATSQLLHCSAIACCYNVCCNDYPPPPAYNDGGVSVCLCFRGTGTDKRVDSGTIRNGQSITKVSGTTCVTFSATAYCCVYTAINNQGGYPPKYNTKKWIETGYYVYADVKKHDYCANVTCFCTSLYTNTSARSHRLCDVANNATIPTSGGPS